MQEIKLQIEIFKYLISQVQNKNVTWTVGIKTPELQIYILEI